MALTIEVISDPEFGGFTARVPDVPAYGEGATEDAAIADLQEALRGYIETFGLLRDFGMSPTEFEEAWANQS